MSHCSVFLKISEHGTYAGVVVVPRILATLSDFILCGCGLRNKMLVLSHSPPPCSAADGECRHPATAAAAFAGGRFAPLWQPLGGSGGTISPPLCRSAPLRPLHPPQGGLRDGLTKPAFCRRQPAFLRRSCGGGSFASLTPCRLRRHIQAALRRRQK